MCTEYWLTAWSKLTLEKSVVSSTDSLDMTIDVDWDVKPQLNKQTNKEAIIMIQLIIKCRVKI